LDAVVGDDNHDFFLTSNAAKPVAEEKMIAA
jgi:hypothetical protein